MLSGDYAAPPTAVLKQALTRSKDQISIEPSGGNRYIALNTTVKPFDNVNVRKAIGAVIDRDGAAARRAAARRSAHRHALPPAGDRRASRRRAATKGPGFDFTSSPTATSRSRWST